MTELDSRPSQFQILLGGSPAPEELVRATLSVSVESSLLLPSVAELELHDTALRWVDDDRLGPGASLEMRARAGSEYHTIFDGEIVELEPNYGPTSQRLTVRAFDRLHRLSRVRQVRSFVEVCDSDLADQLASEAGLKAQTTDTGQFHPFIFQEDVSNLELLQARARALGFVLFVEGKTLHFHPREDTLPPVELSWGTSLVEFRPRLTTLGSVGQVKVRGWDPSSRQDLLGEAEGQRTAEVSSAQSGHSVASEAFQITTVAQPHSAPVRSQSEADAIAKATADALEEPSLQAEGRCRGSAQLLAGRSVSISGVGERFSGSYFLTTATHRYSPAQGYTTAFTASGLSPGTITALLRPPRLGGLGTVAIGVVTDNQDPDSQGRIKVRFPGLSDEHGSTWARVVAPGGGPERGVVFLPEIDDEVLVAFEQGDIRFPYILGGLWNGVDALPGEVAVEREAVSRRVIRSRTGHTIVLDDTDEGAVQITDRDGNLIELTASAIEISAKGDLSISAGGKVSISAGTDVEIGGQGIAVDGGAKKVSLKGIGVALNGGPASVDLKGSSINLN